MESLKGLGKSDRKHLAAVLQSTKGTITVAEAAAALGLPAEPAAKMLARCARAGWLSRVRRGLYVPVPLEAMSAEVPPDPWIIAVQLYAPCYIGGWSAAEYWDLTEQISRTTVVMTLQRPRTRSQTFRQTSFLLRSIPEKALFGLKSVWRGQVKVEVSDPTRTVLDMLSDPVLGGGLRSAVDMFRQYLNSDKKDLGLLLSYAERLGNGAVYKRLGFLLEKFAGGETEALEYCRERLTTGNAKLDPALPEDKLVTRWRLWVPANFLQEETSRMNKQIIGMPDRNKQVPATLLALGVAHDALLTLIRSRHIKRLALFGSAARGELKVASDIDLLVEFEPGQEPSLGGMTSLNEEFSRLFGGRKVDLATRSILNNPYRRRAIEKDIEELYAA